jgi:hypothetical protein
MEFHVDPYNGIRLHEVIKLCNSGDIIKLIPSSYDSLIISSKDRPIELTISSFIEDFNHTIISKIELYGLFNITFNYLKLYSLNLSLNNSYCKFNNCRFTARNKLILQNCILNNIIFDDCIFDFNFQIQLINCNCQIEITSCKIKNRVIPLLYVKNSVLKVNSIDEFLYKNLDSDITIS